MDRRHALILLGGLLLGCHGSPSTTAPGPRVVSLAPSTTEAVFAIGAGAELVGRTKFCDFPAEARHISVVGGFSDPSLEAIVALGPSLVTGARGPAGPSLDDQLKARGIATFFPETESVASIRAMIRGLSQRLDRAADGDRVDRAIAERLEQIDRALVGRAMPRVILLFDRSPLVVAGPGGFPDELLRLAHGTNVITAGGAYPTIGLERLVALDPDVIVDATGAGHADGASVVDLRQLPGFKELRAVRAGFVRPLDGSTALRPGPRVAEGVLSLARAIHGTVDVVAEAP